jgi:hypothetical protein
MMKSRFIDRAAICLYINQINHVNRWQRPKSFTFDVTSGEIKTCFEGLIPESGNWDDARYDDSISNIDVAMPEKYESDSAESARDDAQESINDPALKAGNEHRNSSGFKQSDLEQVSFSQVMRHLTA